MLHEIARGLLDLVAPPRCADCRNPLGRDDAPTPLARVLCRGCGAGFERFPHPRCAHCQVPLPVLDAAEGPRHPLCHDCTNRFSPLDSCTAGVVYRGEAERWIQRFKYPGRGISALRPEAEGVVRALILEAGLAARDPGEARLIPIPLHPRPLRERGFNPALVLARALARHHGVAVATSGLDRVRDTASQTRLGRRARRSNVRGAFACDRAAPPTVWLVDDVVTTGATLEEAARTLRRSGAETIHAFVAARTPLQEHT